jgi:hypothetical protein
VPVFEPIEVEGLRELSRALRRLGSDLPKALRLAGNEAADIVVQDARRRVPKRSGRAAASIKAKSTRTAVRISSGGRRAPYMPWLDYGGKVGRNDSASRPFIADGRYVYPSFRDNRNKVDETYRKSLQRIASDAGLEIG